MSCHSYATKLKSIDSIRVRLHLNDIPRKKDVIDGTLHKHWRPAFMKQVFPILASPHTPCTAMSSANHTK